MGPVAALGGLLPVSSVAAEDLGTSTTFGSAAFGIKSTAPSY